MSLRSAPIRVAFCITELEPGGAERCLVELVRRLDRQRFEPTVYCLAKRPAGNGTSLADSLEACGVRVECLGARGIFDSPFVMRRLRQELKRDAPEIVQCFLFHANVLGTLAARAAGVPHILTGIRVAERRARWHLRLARWTDRWNERHVCVSESVRDFSISEGGLSEHKLVVIPNGVDVARFSGVGPCVLPEMGVSPGRRVISYVGRLDAQKGLAWLLELLPAIFARLPDHDLLLVGDGPERASLQAITARLGLKNRVHSLGFRDHVPAILAASDLLALPSRWEGMPNVILEAMASGKPVVATDVEGVREVLGVDADAQIASAADAEDFSNKVVALASQHDLATRLGEENRRRVAEHFSLERMAAAYQALYESLVAAHR